MSDTDKRGRRPAAVTFHGKPCRTCGGTERLQRNNRCVACVRRSRRNHARTPKGKACAKRYYEKNKSRCREAGKLYNRLRRVAAPDAMRLARRKWAISNRESERASCRKWRAKNKEYFGGHLKKRAALIRDRTPFKWPRQLLKQRALFYGLKCAYCSTGRFETWDHVVPLSRGGWHVPGNLRPSCKTCNSSKHGRTLSEFLTYREELATYLKEHTRRNTRVN